MMMDGDQIHRASSSSSSLHDALGGGFVADVVLWRRSDVAMTILLAPLAAWLLFRLPSPCQYTLLSLVSNVLLLLISILFLWAKAAQLLGRPLPPIPNMRISEEVVEKVATRLQSGLNMMFSSFHDIASGKNSKLFYQVFVCLWMISVLGSLMDFTTFCYTSIVAIITIPALYEKFEECIHRYIHFTYTKLRMYERFYERVSIKCLHEVKNWMMGILKES